MLAIAEGPASARVPFHVVSRHRANPHRTRLLLLQQKLEGVDLSRLLKGDEALRMVGAVQA